MYQLFFIVTMKTVTVLFLTRIAIICEGVKGKRKTKVKLSTADLQNEARRIVWNELAGQLKQFSSGTQIIKEMERLPIAVHFFYQKMPEKQPKENP